MLDSFYMILKAIIMLQLFVCAAVLTLAVILHYIRRKNGE